MKQDFKKGEDVILVLDETRDRVARASIYADALADLAPVRSSAFSELDALDLAAAWGVIVCELDAENFGRTARLLENASLDWGWKVVACVGAGAERVKDRLLSRPQHPALVLTYPTVATSMELRAIGLVVYLRACRQRRYVQSLPA